MTQYRKNIAISLARGLLKEAWTPNSNNKLQKLSTHAIFLFLGERLQLPNLESFRIENLHLDADQILDTTLNYISSWELERNLALIGDFCSSFRTALENCRNKVDKDLKSKEEKEFKELLQGITYLDSLTQHTIQVIPLIFLYRAQNHFIDALNYAERAIFKSYEIAKILNLTFNLQPALQVLGFSSLKEFYVAISLIFNALSQNHGIFDLSTCNINLENDPDGIKAQKIKDLLGKALKHASFDHAFLQDSYQEMKTKELKKEFIPFAQHNPFIKKPLMKVGDTTFLCPDPKCILAYASWGLLGEIRNGLKGSEKERLDTQRGIALEKYFAQFALKRAEPKTTPTKKETPSTADFFIKTPNRVCLVEVKNSLGLRAPIFNPKEHLKVWKRLWHAYNQCIASKDSETAHFIMVADETVLIEATSFFLFAHHAAKINISQVSLISASLFTDLILTEKLDEFIEAQKERANYFIQNPQYENLMRWIEMEQDFSIDNNSAQYYEHIKKELLPPLSQFVEEHLPSKPAKPKVN